MIDDAVKIGRPFERSAVKYETKQDEHQIVNQGRSNNCLAKNVGSYSAHLQGIESYAEQHRPLVLQGRRRASQRAKQPRDIGSDNRSHCPGNRNAGRNGSRPVTQKQPIADRNRDPGARDHCQNENHYPPITCDQPDQTD